MEQQSQREKLSQKQPPQPNLSFLETAPWTPPADAAPQIALKDFCRRAWPILEPAVPFIDGWHLDCFVEHAEAISFGTLPEFNLLVNTPPGTTKSMFWSVLWPAWEWHWAPWFRWLTTSYDDGLATRDAVKTRRLMQTAWYHAHKAIDWDFAGDQNLKHNYVNDRTGWRIAASIAGEITGNHAHRVLVDDPHHVKKAESDAVRQATVDLWRETFPSRVLPGGYRIVIGQRTHEEDVPGEWMKLEGKRVHHIKLREEYTKPKKPDLGHAIPPTSATDFMACTLTGKMHDRRKVEGELLTPQRYGPEVIANRKIELGDYAYSAQYDQEPAPRAGAVLDPRWFPQTPRLEASTVDLVATFDLNYSDLETSDWSIGHLAAVERSVRPRIHVIDRFAEHMGAEKHAEHIAEWLLVWRPVLVGIEKRAWEKHGATRDLCRQIMDYCEERHYIVNVEPIDPEGDKVIRAMIIPGRAKAGLITFDRTAPWWPTVSRQFGSFPRSVHDDDVDALAYMVKMVVEKLEKVRAMSLLLGHSSPLIMADAPAAQTDWAKAMLAGVR